MSTAYVVVTLVAAALAAFSGSALLRRAPWVVDNLVEYGVPRSWWPWLGTAKVLGAIGLLVGLLVPAIGIAAGVGLVLYFAGAVVTVARARWYSHIPYPIVYMAPVVGSLALAA